MTDDRRARIDAARSTAETLDALLAHADGDVLALRNAAIRIGTLRLITMQLVDQLDELGELEGVDD